MAPDLIPGCPADNQCIQVTLRKTVPFAFAQTFGFSSQQVEATATARAGRELPHRAGVITIGPTGHSGVNVMPSPSGTVEVVGDVVSNDFFAAGGVSRLSVVDGRVYYRTTVTGSGQVDPDPPILDEGLYRSATDLPDPIARAVQHGQLTFPTPPSASPWGGCGGIRTMPDPGDPLAVPPEPPEDDYVDLPVGPGVEVRVKGHATARLSPGHYCSITVSESGNVIFETASPNDVYVIHGDVTASGSANVTFQAGRYLITGNASFSNSAVDEERPSTFFGNGEYFIDGSLEFSGNADASSELSDIDTDGAYFQVLGPGPDSPPVDILTVRARDTASLTLKGKPEYHDILFHVPVAKTRRFIDLPTLSQSEFIGTLYVPGTDSYVNLTGNADGGAYRVRRGNSLRGGRVIVYHIHMFNRPGGGTSLAVDYPTVSPDIVRDYVREPTLVRAGT
jgi:hypothetical protein